MPKNVRVGSDSDHEIRIEESSLLNMNSVDIILGLHVDLNPVVFVVGGPVGAEVVVDHVIMHCATLVAAS